MEHDQKRPGIWSEALYGVLAPILARGGIGTADVRGTAKDRFGAAVREMAVVAAVIGGGLALGGAPAFGGIVPFGCAAICAYDRYFPVLSGAACIGALLHGQVMLPAIYAILLMFRLITRMWVGEESERVRVAAAACAMGLHGLLELITGTIGLSAILFAVASVAAGGAFTVCFRALVRPEARYTPLFETGVFAATYAASCALCGMRIASITLAYPVGFLITVVLARMGGSARGCVAGLLWGLGCKAEYAPAFALAGLLAGKVPSALLGVGGGAMLCMIYASFTGGYYAVRDFLPDVGIAAALYAPLDKYRLLPRGKLFGESYAEDETIERTVCENAAARATEERLQGMAEALHSLSAIFYGMSERLSTADGYSEREDITEVFAADYASMSALIRQALADGASAPDRALAARVRGALAAAGFRCRSVAVCGTGRKTLIARGVARHSAALDPQALATRLSALTGMQFAPPEFTVDEQSITMTAHTVPILSAQVERALSRKAGEQVSGDCATWFTTKDDLFYCLLCDGMGSGRDAAVAARTCCVFLQKMLEGGNDPALCLEMLNSFLRGKGYECFATIDLFCVNLYTGNAYFIKGGSAPSYLLRDGNLCKITSATAPVGIIREVRAERISLSVRSGDRIFMASDGVEDGEHPLIERLGEQALSGGADAVAARLLTIARSHRGAKDDATVCVVQIT